MATDDIQQAEMEIVDAGTRLLDAIQARDTPQTLALLQQGAPIWYQEEETGWSALHFAAHYEDVALVELLIDRGAIWNMSQSRFFCIHPTSPARF
jgi:protein arginine N-methyltransferase 2